MANVLAGVNLAREEAYRQMLARGFRTMIQGVTMHRPNTRVQRARDLCARRLALGPGDQLSSRRVPELQPLA